MKLSTFQQHILQGIPNEFPPQVQFDNTLSHAPKRKDILNIEEKKLALKNALRYFDKKYHKELSQEFLGELNTYGRIYMFRFKPTYAIYARPISEYPHKSIQAAAIMHMLSNNLDNAIAQHPQELITYGGNGAVFQNWAQYLITMQYLATMTDEQTLVLYSGHPMGLFPSHKNAPRVVVTNGLMIPNYSKPDDLEKYNALGVTQYGQMTAGSFMYIGPQGIVHGTNITLLNAARKLKSNNTSIKVFVSSGLGGMSGAQPKAAKIAGLISIIAEVNIKAVNKRHQQGWVDEIFEDLNALAKRLDKAKQANEAISIAYVGNVVDLWEYFVINQIKIDIGSDQTSLHNPWSGGYYPCGFSVDESNNLIANQPIEFKTEVQKTLVRHVNAINTMVSGGMYFFDYGNAFLLESGRAGADIYLTEKPTFGGLTNASFKFKSYVQDILGPQCFDYGFGPFRWVCTSANTQDLKETDYIALQVLTDILTTAPKEIAQQLQDNINWIKKADENKLVVGSQARILYADSEGRIKIALAINQAIKNNKISAPVVLGRDHHDVSGTDSPYRETSNIYDGSSFTADMATHTFIGNSFRGATWISLHNGGGVGWGEVINGGFGLVLDGTDEAEEKAKSMLFWDVNNGIARRAWARNKEAQFAIQREEERTPTLKVTIANLVDENTINQLFF